MKYLLLALLILLFACGPSAEEKCKMEEAKQDSIMAVYLSSAYEGLTTFFDSPFPKRNKNLADILGDTIQIEGICSPQTLRIVSNRKTNLVIDIDRRDTIFKGIVCKFRDLYFLSEQLSNSSYRISALRITDSTIYGLKPLQRYLQYSKVDSVIARGEYTKLIQSPNKLKLTPDKKELRKLFTSILNRTQPSVIIKNHSESKKINENIIVQLDAEDFEMLSKVYPNPAKDVLNVDLQSDKGIINYQLTDINGKIIKQGQFSGISGKIEVDELPCAIYSLSISGLNKQKEVVKIIKVN